MQAKAGEKKGGTKKARAAAPKDESAPLSILIDPEAVYSPTGLAAELVKAADWLTSAAESGAFCEALERNLQVWVAVKSLVNRQNGQIDDETRTNLTQLADQVAAGTFVLARDITADSVTPLVAINLEVSKALVEGVLNQLIRDRAYYLWQEAGGEHGQDKQFWFTAEREIRSTVSVGD